MPSTTQPPYRLIAPGFERSGEPDLGYNRIITRYGMQEQLIQFLGISPALGFQAANQVTSSFFALTDPQAAVGPSAVVTVSNTTFVGQSASLFVGPYELVSEIDFVIAGGAAAIAASIATAVSALPGFTGTPVGAAVTVTRKGGIAPDELRFSASYRGGNVNFTFTWPTNVGYLGYTTNIVQPMQPFM